MKKLIFLFAVVLALGGCKKNTDVMPKNPVDAVVGRYKLTSFSLEQGTQRVSLPGNGQSLNGVAELSKSTTDGKVLLLLTVNNNTLFDQSDDAQFEVRKAGEGYGLFDGSDQYADLDGSNIIFHLDETNADGQSVSISFVGNK